MERKNLRMQDSNSRDERNMTSPRSSYVEKNSRVKDITSRA